MKIRNLFICTFLCIASMPSLAWNIDDIKPLYYELMSFKDTQTFAELGFAPASPYHDWLDRVSALREDDKSDMKILLAHGFLAGDLLMLGQEYRSSKGVDTEYSRGMRIKIDAAIE